MKLSSLIAIAAAGVLSASASACPVYISGNQTDGTSQPAVRTLLHSSTTISCTPREYWLPAQCTSARSVSDAAKAGRGTTSHVKTSTKTCTSRAYWLPAHCQ